MIKINFGTSLCKIDAKSSEINLNLERSSIIASPSSNISAWAEVPTFIERNFQTYSNIQHVLQAFETVFTTYRWFSLDFMKQIGDCSKFSDNFQEKIRKFKPILGKNIKIPKSWNKNVWILLQTLIIIFLEDGKNRKTSLEHNSSQFSVCFPWNWLILDVSFGNSPSEKR